MPYPRFALFLALTFASAASVTRADEVRATVTLNETGTLQFQNPPATTGAPLSPSLSGTYGSVNVAASLGSVTANLDLSGKPTGSDSASAGGNWKESYTINASNPALNGTSATANFTYSLSGTFTGGNLNASDQVNYGAAIPIQGSSLAQGQYLSGGFFNGTLPPQTFDVPFSFVYGQSFEVSGSLSASANLSGSVGFGHAHLTLRETGFTIAGGNYTSSGAGGAGKGATFASNTDYDGFTLANTVGHGTTATFLDGSAGAARDVSLNFGAPATGILTASDTVDVKGPLDDTFVLQLNYDPAAANTLFGGESGLYLAWFDDVAGVWRNAVLGNTGGTSTHFDRAYNGLTDFVLGNWGIDTVANTVWAVVNHNSEYAVTSLPVPEPASWILLGGGGLILSGIQLRRKRWQLPE